MPAFIFLILFLATSVNAQTSGLAESIARGAPLYDANCSSCHKADGKGDLAQGVKPLDGSTMVKTQTALQIAVVLKGVPGKAMPSFSSKTDAELADIITYTKNSWSNTTGFLVTPQMIAGGRVSRSKECFETQFVVPRIYDITTPTRTVTTSAGKADVFWCALPTRQGDVPGLVYWSPQVAITLNALLDKTVLLAALGRITTSSDPIAQIWTEILNSQVVLTPGSQLEYERNKLRWLGCENLRTGSPPGQPWNPPLPSDWCGPAPTPPVVNPPPNPTPTEVWWVPKASTVANPPGTRPTYLFNSSNIPYLECFTCRVPEYSICTMDEPRKTYGTVVYGKVLGSSTRYSVCVRKP